MAKNVIINGVAYNAVPEVKIPLSGEAGNATFYETSDATASANHILSGYSAYNSTGKINGTLTTPTVAYDSTTHILTIS